jgi:hypothetical protein
MTELLVLLLGMVAIGLAWSTFFSSEAKRPDPEFKDMRGVVRTDTTMDSSYAQRTNHMPAPAVKSPPLEGMETPFQVNAYRAFLKLSGGPPPGRLQEKTV